MKRVQRSVLRIVAALALAIAVSVAGFSSAPEAKADGWGSMYYGNCSMDTLNYTNLYGYAIGQTVRNSWPACYRSKTRVYYPYLNVSESGWGYPESLAYSPYQASPVGSEHRLCLVNGSCSGWSWISS